MLVALEVDLVGYTPAGSEPHFVTNTLLHRSLLYRSSFLPKVFFVENKAHHNRILNCPRQPSSIREIDMSFKILDFKCALVRTLSSRSRHSHEHQLIV